MNANRVIWIIHATSEVKVVGLDSKSIKKDIGLFIVEMQKFTGHADIPQTHLKPWYLLHSFKDTF